MQLIKKESEKLFCSYDLGTIEETSAETKEKTTYQARLTVRYEPIIIFPDGDMAIIEWNDILEFAKWKKDKVKKET
ncbi:MAG: hypothetical protein J5982_03430 [Bacilli bacterium]|nr:hypothetical protein [Bacilli bacterium]